MLLVLHLASAWPLNMTRLKYTTTALKLCHIPPHFAQCTLLLLLLLLPWLRMLLHCVFCDSGAHAAVATSQEGLTATIPSQTLATHLTPHSSSTLLQYLCMW
jgi:hypothetical protein